jgi:hypothetical protein
MCYLVTIGTLESRDSIEVILGESRLLAVRPSRNPSLRALFPEGDRLFELTSGHCSCNFVIRSAEPSVEQQRARLRARYGRKGWSQTKMARALTDWEVAHERRVERDAAPEAQWRALARMLASRPGGLRVLVHFYSGEFDTEVIQTGTPVSTPVDLLLDERIADDILTTVVP